MTTSPENSRRRFLQHSARSVASLVLSSLLPLLAANQVLDLKHTELFQLFCFKNDFKLRYRVVSPMTNWTDNNDTWLLAAAGIRQYDDAAIVLEMGLALVGVGHGLVMNSDCIELVQAGKSTQIQITLHKSTRPANTVPTQLWVFIEGAKGWFDLVE